MQPLIAPLYEGHTAHELVSLLSDDSEKSAHDLVHDYWQSQRSEKGQAFEAFWETSLHDGVMAGTALPAASATLRSDFVQQAPAAQAASSGLEIVFRPDPTIGDGEYANNGWLQETPKPVTRLTWDNAAMISPATAQQLGLTYQRLRHTASRRPRGQRRACLSFLAMPTIPSRFISAMGVRTVEVSPRARDSTRICCAPLAAPWMATDLQIAKTGETYAFASVQHQYTIDFEGHPDGFRQRDRLPPRPGADRHA